MKSVKLFLILAFLPWPSALANDSSGVTVSPEAHLKLFLSHANSLSRNSSTALLDSFHVVTADPVAGDSTEYALHFILSRKVFFSLSRGGFSFSFPDGFDLSLIQVLEVIDDYPFFGYRVKGYEISDALLTLFLTKRDRKGGPWPDSAKSCQPVHVTILLDVIGNPTETGEYQLAGLAFDRHDAVIAGPNFSDQFSIIPGPLYAVNVSPADDITVTAGDVIMFSAVGVDQFGNVITSLVFGWFLADGSDSIGEFSGSVFQALTVGQGWAVAATEGVLGQSGLIIVVPGELAEMELKISPEQVVGQPFLQLAEIALYDAYGNLKTDYNLPEKPISLVPDDGSLAPDVIDDQQLLSDGVIDILPAAISYAGPTAVVGIYATNGEVTSATVEVSFNGYDILAVLDINGLPMDQLYSGLQNSALVVVQNNGRLTAPSGCLVRAHFESGGDWSEARFGSSSNGVIDSIRIILPTAPEHLSEDILAVELTAEYDIGGQTYATTNRRELPVELVAPYSFEIIENSFRPDTAYPGEPFEISFDVAADGFGGPIHRTDLVVSLARAGNRAPIIYRGSPRYSSFENGVISYSGLPAVVELHHNLQPGWYIVQLDYGLISNGVCFELTSPCTDSIYLLPELQVSYVPNSLEPTTVFAGAEATFSFALNLGNDFPVAIDPDDARFTVTGSGFSASINLVLSADSLFPGENSIETEMMFIPLSQLGESLHVNASLPLIIPGVGGAVVFETDFDSWRLFVQERPIVQILGVDIVSPNQPMVNTGQSFQIRCRVANLSNFVLGPLELGLGSDGSSVFDSTLTIQSIDAHDTVEIYFDVVASQEPNAGEVFQVDILSAGISWLPPVDNVALVTVQRPAELEFSYSLLGAEDGLVGQGESFSLTVELCNLGEAAVSEGTFSLTTGGVDFGVEDPITGSITVGLHVTFPFRAPSYDTAATFVFSLVDLPLDSNTNAPAIIGETSFEFTLRVESFEADLLVEPLLIGSNLVLPGRKKELFRLNLTNRGTSSVTGIRLDEIDIAFVQADNSVLNVGSILDPTVSGFYEDGLPVSHALLSGNRLLLLFDDFVVPPAQTRSIIFTAKFKATVPSSFRLDLEKHHISAAFKEGPNAGQPVEISSTVAGERLISQVYATKGKVLQESFVIENNPFNPEISEAWFSYELDEPSVVEFRVFTLMGEEVYAKDLPEGSEGARLGENDIPWDGRNNAGHMVRNGVYIVSIKIVRTGEYARMKVAVVK